ncbi:hypothetical protein F5Y11DRAFT_351327 [Daldinia sp. FL1419]|nr:hypothetical protein F5Y11DRAFT_351327 [Daldinia sp. FL1419]
MTGKFWSPAEEKYFWKSVVPHSIKRAPADLCNEEKTWEELAADMQKVMEQQGTVRRLYSGSVLFEHYFQNVEGDRRSPHATHYVVEYLKKLGPFRRLINPRSGPRGGRPRRREVTVSNAPGVQAPPSSPNGFTVTPLEEDDVFSPEYAARQARHSTHTLQLQLQSHKSKATRTPRSPRLLNPSLKPRRLQKIAPAIQAQQALEYSSRGTRTFHGPQSDTLDYKVNERSLQESSTSNPFLSQVDTLLAAAEFVDTQDYSNGSNQAQDHFNLRSAYFPRSIEPQDGPDYGMGIQTSDHTSSTQVAYSSVSDQNFDQNISYNLSFPHEEYTEEQHIGQPSISRSSSSSSLSTIHGAPVDSHTPTGETTEEELSSADEGENKENEGGRDDGDDQLPGFRLQRSNLAQQDIFIYEDGQALHGLRLYEYGNFDTYDANKENEGIRMDSENNFGIGVGDTDGVPVDVFDVTGELPPAMPAFASW